MVVFTYLFKICVTHDSNVVFLTSLSFSRRKVQSLGLDPSLPPFATPRSECQGRDFHSQMVLLIRLTYLTYLLALELLLQSILEMACYVHGPKSGKVSRYSRDLLPYYAVSLRSRNLSRFNLPIRLHIRVVCILSICFLFDYINSVS